MIEMWQSTVLEGEMNYPQYAQYEGTRGREQMLADQPSQPAYRVFLKPNQVGQAQTQQLPMVGSYGYAPYPASQIHISAPPPLPVAPVAQTIRPVFNVIPNPGSADALRRVQNQMAAQRVAMSQLKENLGYAPPSALLAASKRQIHTPFYPDLSLLDHRRSSFASPRFMRLRSLAVPTPTAPAPPHPPPPAPRPPRSYVRQVVDGLKAELALQDSGKKAVTFKDLARLKKYIDINRASVKTLQDKDRELDLQVPPAREGREGGAGGRPLRQAGGGGGGGGGRRRARP
jgi:hypothetical protein